MAPHISVDLTPVLPGGANGGAKVFTLELLRAMFELEPTWEWTILTSASSHEELGSLEGPNRRRFCILPAGGGSSGPDPRNDLLRRGTRRLLAGLPTPIRRGLWSARARVSRWRAPSPAGGARADLLFCPFTAPTYAAPPTPTVSTFYDLQYLEYPHFFSEAERQERDRTLRNTLLLSGRIVCISQFVADTLLAHSRLPRDRVRAVPLGLAGRLDRPTGDRVRECLERHGLRPGGYFLYPANTWPHKNHLMLLLAYSRLPRPSAGGVQLVLTGAPGGEEPAVGAAISAMGLAPWVKRLGFVDDRELAALLAGCRALLFPSLYEGFGIPVVEAFGFGVPVLCSDRTSLPEVAGGAAWLFDPRRPTDILRAVADFEAATPDEHAHRRSLGFQRVNEIGGAEQMARRYRAVFLEALSSASYRDHVEGVFADGWTGRSFRVTVAPRSENAVLRLRLTGPISAAGPRGSRVVFRRSRPAWPRAIELGPDQTRTIELGIPTRGGQISGAVTPTFCPQALGLGADARELGCRIQAIEVITGAGADSLLETPG